jgi:GNAT superfamily N-acetyltransferase
LAKHLDYTQSPNEGITEHQHFVPGCTLISGSRPNDLPQLSYEDDLGAGYPETASEYGSVQALIETVANETFKDLFAPNPVPLKFKDEDWPLSWVAVSDERIVGVILTSLEWVDDLWVLPEQRRRGVGSRLLAQGEAEIAARGYRTCHLRVVRSNTVAIRFYLRHGWQTAREFAHEKYHHPMFEMAKQFPQHLN